MKKLLFPLLILSLIFASCSDDDDKVAEQLETDIELIEQYLVDSNLTAQSTGSGLYYIMEEEGTGDRPDIFAYVTIDFTGKLLDGSVFSEDTIEHYSLYGLIEGWQEGIQLFKQDGKGTLFVPSKLGYGETVRVDAEGDTIIPANSILIFDFRLDSVELRDDL
jgi:FKBP-type peptidyl-prolyl cis-trans isomerase FkpA